MLAGSLNGACLDVVRDRLVANVVVVDLDVAASDFEQALVKLLASKRRVLSRELGEESGGNNVGIIGKLRNDF